MLSRFDISPKEKQAMHHMKRDSNQEASTNVEASVRIDRNQRLRGQQNLYWLLGDLLPSSNAQDESRRNVKSTLY
jgi:hypothetical protein